jgi:MFS family permease
MVSDRSQSNEEKGLGLIFRALSHRNYRLFFAGQGISLIGTWVQLIAMSWLVYRLSNSAFLLGMTGFLGMIPTFVLAPFAGVLTDRWDRRRILLITQTLSMVQALVLATLDLTGAIRVWHLFILIPCLGIVNAFDAPARQTFVVELVEKREDLGNAIALNSFLFNGARLVGPSIGGILISILGEGMCFLLNGLSFFSVIVALLAMRIISENRASQGKQMWQVLKEGFNYTFGFAPIRFILFLLGLASLMGMPYTVLMPVFAKDILHGGPQTLGFLMAASGVGAVIAALYLASRKSVLGLGRIIAVASGVFGIGLIGFSLSHVLWLSLLLLVFVGFGMMVHIASSNTVLQTMVDDDKRGRVMSFFMMSMMGMTPFGSLLSGFLASKIGASSTLIIGGASCILGSFLFSKKLPLIREMIRPIYLKKGIIREGPKVAIPLDR